MAIAFEKPIVLFNDYFSTISGVSAVIYNRRRTILILDNIGKTITELHFANAIDFHITAKQLFNPGVLEGDYIFAVFEKGIDGKNWLYFFLKGSTI